MAEKKENSNQRDEEEGSAGPLKLVRIADSGQCKIDLTECGAHGDSGISRNFARTCIIK